MAIGSESDTALTACLLRVTELSSFAFAAQLDSSATLQDQLSYPAAAEQQQQDVATAHAPPGTFDSTSSA